VKTKSAASVAAMNGPTESVRDRILSTARELFYREGVRGVGVDTVVAQSGVAKTSLYRWFPSKDALIAAVIEAEGKDRWAAWDRSAERCHDMAPRDRLRFHLSSILKFVSRPEYRGCPFMNAAAELPDPQHPARIVCFQVSHELRQRVRRLVDAIEGLRDPEELADQLLLLVEGTLSAAVSIGKEGPQKYLLTAADAMVDAQLRKAEESQSVASTP
jgi:AcrR family transcriptional regulator